jgi:hypothetical protein
MKTYRQKTIDSMERYLREYFKGKTEAEAVEVLEKIWWLTSRNDMKTAYKRAFEKKD